MERKVKKVNLKREMMVKKANKEKANKTDKEKTVTATKNLMVNCLKYTNNNKNCEKRLKIKLERTEIAVR